MLKATAISTCANARRKTVAATLLIGRWPKCSSSRHWVTKLSPPLSTALVDQRRTYSTTPTITISNGHPAQDAPDVQLLDHLQRASGLIQRATAAKGQHQQLQGRLKRNDGREAHKHFSVIDKYLASLVTRDTSSTCVRFAALLPGDDGASLGVLTSDLLVLTLSCLGTLARLVPPKLRQRVDYDMHTGYSNGSPFLSPLARDVLSLWISQCAAGIVSISDVIDVLCACAELHVGERSAVTKLCLLVAAPNARIPSIAQRVASMRAIALCHSRLGAATPDFSSILSPFQTAEVLDELTKPDLLYLLSSLVKIKERRYHDIIRILERRLVPHVGSFTVQDTIFALRALAFLPYCHEHLASAVLDHCALLVPAMTPRELGDVCHCLTAMLRTGRPGHGKLHVAQHRSTLNQLTAATARRAESCLGKFSYRDARLVLDLLALCDVRHGMVFAHLTPLIRGGSTN